MNINREMLTQRKMKALTIAGSTDQIKRLNAVTYKVKSQTSETWYDVIHEYKFGWTCSCPDHVYRKVECKHIMSVYLSKQLRNKIVNNSDVREIEQQKEDLVCRCGSLEVIKIGIRHNKSGNIQRFKCKKCAHKWSDNLGFANNKVNSKIITVAIDLYFKGVSLRKVKEHLKLFYGIDVSPSSVLYWIRKFGEVVAPYVDQFQPQLSRVYHVDEMMIHVRKEQHDKGHYSWLWNMMDNTTRFWITSKVSQRREVEDAQAVFQEAKTRAPKPLAIVHDGLQSYNGAYRKEYRTMKDQGIRNVRSVSVRHKGLNQKVERLNGIFRDREVVMRGMDHKGSAQKLVNAYRVHYNFVRNHGSIKKTPAEEANIKLDLGQNKIESLIKLASNKRT